MSTSNDPTRAGNPGNSNSMRSENISTEANDTIWEFRGDELAENDAKTLRIYYNNRNGLEIYPLITTKLKQKREKSTTQFLGYVENSKAEKMLNQLKAWDINIACLTEMCVV